MSTRLNWGILGTGRIAGIFAQGVALSQHSRVVAVGSRAQASAERFAKEFAVSRAHATYEALLADPEVQAVYISTPHPQHVEWTVRAAEAGKHILCEKPIGLNHPETTVMVEAAREHGVLLMEAFMYRCHPQTAKILEIIKSGALGEVRMVQAAFGFNAGFDPQSRLWSNELAGGGMLDVGCYPVSFARLIAGAASGQPFLDPVSVTGTGVLHPETGVDSAAAATLKFANGVIAQVSTSVYVTQDNCARIYGTAAMLHVPTPWLPASEGQTSQLHLHKDGKIETIDVLTTHALYGMEADAVALAVARGEKEVAAMSLADSLGNMATLDAWRSAVGLTYEQEKPENFTHTHKRTPLKLRAGPLIPHGKIEGLSKPVARLIMGCDNQFTMPHGAAVWDDYFERGGNAFDTAHIYWNGVMERNLGQWVRRRGVRDQVTVIAKGAHTPWCTPEWLVKQFDETLDRLQMDRVDIYMMHRDNLAVPVGEFVDVLNAQVRADRMKVFGGSNWSLARVAEANAYAKSKGLQGFGVVSNNFSLARMVEPVWTDCISASDPASRQWLTENCIPLLAWSSQARGFFTERAGRDKRDDSELVRCWYADDNFVRRDRAYALAKKKGVPPIAIAAAYVLAQPFPTFALIGPRQISETVSSLVSLGVTLTVEEMAWLNLERETA